jgi:spore coat protein H
VRRLLAVVVLSSLGLLASTTARTQPRDATHGRDAEPDYARVFAQDVVKQLDIRVTAADWERLVADMTEMAGPQSAGGGPGGFNTAPDPAAVSACSGRLEGDACSFGAPPQGGRCTLLPMGIGLTCTPLPGGGLPGGGTMPPGRGGGPVNPVGNVGRDDVEFLPRTPVYIPATLTFDGITFTNIGLRLKGNSSLLNSWRSGSDKLPFRLNADGLEDQLPEARDQTFFGFPNLNLTNNSQDASFLRAKVVGDLFRQAGLPAVRTAFVRVFFDRGGGSQYLGLYTLVEIPDEPMLAAQFGSEDGNLYKPSGTGARWTVFLAESFPKKTNRSDEDWTDVQDAIAVLNGDRSNAAVWRSRLEARFAVSAFLRWLALNTIIGNTDTYGGFAAHNYWVYGSPRHRDRLFFIPWDHDLAMNGAGIGGAPGGGAPGGGAPGGGPGGGGGLGGGGLDLFHDSVNAQWPLIRYLMDDPVYRAAYRGYLQEMLNTVFEPTALTARLQTEYARIAPYVVGAEGEQVGRTFLASPSEFTQAVTSLLAYVPTRVAAVRQALETSR